MSDPVQPLTPAQFQQAEQSAEHEGYLHHLAKEFDILGNVATGGMMGESISARIGLDAAAGNKEAIILARILDVTFSPNHPIKAEVADMVQAEDVVKTMEASPDLPKESLP